MEEYQIIFDDIMTECCRVQRATNKHPAIRKVLATLKIESEDYTDAVRKTNVRAPELVKKLYKILGRDIPEGLKNPKMVSDAPLFEQDGSVPIDMSNSATEDPPQKAGHTPSNKLPHATGQRSATSVTKVLNQVIECVASLPEGERVRVLSTAKFFFDQQFLGGSVKSFRGES